MNDLSDEELFNEVIKGNKAAMKFIVQRYYKNIFRYIYLKTNDYHLSEDLCQEVFCKIYEKRNTYSSEYPLKPWIYKIAHNSIIDYMRSSTFKNKNNVQVLDENIKETENVIECNFFDNNIDEYTENLNEHQKEVVKLRFCHQLSIEEIAKVTDSSVNTTKSRLYQGIKNIKNKIKNSLGGGCYESKVK